MEGKCIVGTRYVAGGRGSYRIYCCQLSGPSGGLGIRDKMGGISIEAEHNRIPGKAEGSEVVVTRFKWGG